MADIGIDIRPNLLVFLMDWKFNLVTVFYRDWYKELSFLTPESGPEQRYKSKKFPAFVWRISNQRTKMRQ